VTSPQLAGDAPASTPPPPHHRPEPRWPASLAVIAVAGLYLVLPERLSIGPTFVFPLLVLLVVPPLTIRAPMRHPHESRAVRVAAFAVIALAATANGGSLVLLVHELVGGKVPGRQLLLSALIVWLANVLVFGLWFWELDRGGPDKRAGDGGRAPDFLFPQMGDPVLSKTAWMPSFFDYLYVSFTNATAFSPTDTMPLTPWAKLPMMLQSFASLMTVVLVTARAVNILR